MRIDVDLCGHLLVMHRREEHLKCMLACLEVGVCVHEFFGYPLITTWTGLACIFKPGSD